MNSFLVWLLHRVSPETAHHFAIFLMKLRQRFYRKSPVRNAPAIHLSPVPQLKFTNRLGLAAGFDKNAEAFAFLARQGFGFLEVGTVTPKAQPGNPKPRIWRVSGESLVNHLGFNNVGLEAFHRNLLRLRPYTRGIPVFANVGKNRDTPVEKAVRDYGLGLDMLSDCVDGFVVNLSSPNTPGLFSLQSVEFLESLARFKTGRPTWVKLSPDLSDPEMRDIFDYVNQSGFITGVVLTNTSRKLAEPHFPNGGLSGPPLLTRSLECVALARQHLKAEKILIGVGGVSSFEDYTKMREAGADLIEVYTAFIKKGPAWIRELAARAV